MVIPDLTSKQYLHKDIKQVLAVLETHYTNPSFSIEQLSSELGMSRCTLFRRFKRHTNMLPCQLLTQYRLMKAAEMLNSSDLPVTTIAKKVGYNNSQYFCISFKSFFGITTSEYVMIHRK